MNNTPSIERQSKIEKLQQQIWDIEAEELKENRDHILPFLKDNCILEYESISRYYVNFKDGINVTDLAEFVVSKQDSGYSCSCEISKNTQIRYDDGIFTIHFFFDGLTKEYKKKTIDKCKELGLKISFKNEKERLLSVINKYSKDLEEIKILEEEFEI